jgi:hypothetical protein
MSAERRRAYEEVSAASTAASKRPPPSELARRQRLLEQTFRLRDAIGPIGLTAAELLSDPEEGVDD